MLTTSVSGLSHYVTPAVVLTASVSGLSHYVTPAVMLTASVSGLFHYVQLLTCHAHQVMLDCTNEV